jgi:hypothetical protein
LGLLNRHPPIDLVAGIAGCPGASAYRFDQGGAGTWFPAPQKAETIRIRSSAQIGRVLIGLFLMLGVAGCQVPGLASKPKAATVESVALQPGDLAGFQRCSASGDVKAVLKNQQSTNPSEYDVSATEWAQWSRQGASDAYFVAYGRTASDCAALSASGTGAPSGGLVMGLIVKFTSPTTALRTYAAGSTLLGFGPRDTTFIRLVGGTVETGAQTGFGPESVIASGTATGSTYYVAFWQNKAFDSYLLAYDVASDDARTAAGRVNDRIS